MAGTGMFGSGFSFFTGAKKTEPTAIDPQATTTIEFPTYEALLTDNLDDGPLVIKVLKNTTSYEFETEFSERGSFYFFRITLEGEVQDIFISGFFSVILSGNGLDTIFKWRYVSERKLLLNSTDMLNVPTAGLFKDTFIKLTFYPET